MSAESRNNEPKGVPPAGPPGDEEVDLSAPVERLPVLGRPSGAGRGMGDDRGFSLLRQVQTGALSAPSSHRGQRFFFNFLRRAGADRRVMEQIYRIRDAIVLSVLKDDALASGVTIGLTGIRGGEGTSFVSLLLALSLGECATRSVALIDGRFSAQRYEAISSVLGLSRQAVLLQDGFGEIACSYNELSPNLYFLQNVAGGRSIDFFSDKRIGLFFDAVRRQFDFTVLDLPPLAGGGPAVFVLPNVDRLYLVVEAARSRLAEIDRCLDVVKAAGCKLAGGIVNKQRAPWWARLFWREFFF